MPKNVKCKNCNNLSNHWCERIVDSPDEDMDRDCTYFWQRTNGDRIRAMSDDVLAEFLILSPEMEFDVCRLCQFGNPTPTDDRGQCLAGFGACDAESRAEAFKKWLKQPAEVDHESEA